MLRPLGIDNTVIVDVFPLNTMTQAQLDLQKQAQIDLQNQLEQATVDLTTRPLLNDSPVLYRELLNKNLQLFLNKWNTQKLNTKIRKLLLHMMILIKHKQPLLLQKNDTKS